MAEETKGEKALEGYAKARPYVMRGAKFAVHAALLSKMYSSGKLPTAVTTAAFAAGVGDKALEVASKKNRRLRDVRQAFEKNSGMNTDEDPPRGVFQRNPEALMSQGVELSSVETSNGVLDGLFSKKDEMARQCKEQLGSLFSSKGEGRTSRLGMTADEASKVVNRAFK